MILKTMSEFVAVAEVDSLEPGTGRTVHVRGRDFALYNVDGEFFAVDDRCTHVGASLGAGFCDGATVHCPLHGWAFDVKTGACKSNPRRPVKTYPTRVTNGWVEICIPAEP